MNASGNLVQGCRTTSQELADLAFDTGSDRFLCCSGSSGGCSVRRTVICFGCRTGAKGSSLPSNHSSSSSFLPADLCVLPLAACLSASGSIPSSAVRNNGSSACRSVLYDSEWIPKLSAGFLPFAGLPSGLPLRYLGLLLSKPSLLGTFFTQAVFCTVADESAHLPGIAWNSFSISLPHFHDKSSVHYESSQRNEKVHAPSSTASSKP